MLRSWLLNNLGRANPRLKPLSFFNKIPKEALGTKPVETVVKALSDEFAIPLRLRVLDNRPPDRPKKSLLDLFNGTPYAYESDASVELRIPLENVLTLKPIPALVSLINVDTLKLEIEGALGIPNHCLL